MDDFFVTHKVFSTSQAVKAGISKSYIKKCRNIVDLGTFMVKTDDKSKVRLEHVYTYDPELSKLARKVNKIYKRSNVNQEEIDELVSIVNDKVTKILGTAKKENIYG